MAKTDVTVGELVGMIERGELRLPELQRRYLWPAPRVRDLFDSLYRGYPSGTILVWETDADVPERELAVDQQENAFQGHKLLLDGQQRLTSLSALMTGKPLRLRRRVRPIEILFNVAHPDGPPRDVEDVDYDKPALDDEPDDDADEDDDRTPVQERFRHLTFVVSSRSLRSDPRWISVSDIFDSKKSDWELLKPLSLTPDNPTYDQYSKRLQRVRGIRDYQYVMQVLERTRSYEEVAEIFVRVNSLGVKLRGSDLGLAQITARWPNSLKLFEGFAEECAEANFEFDLGLLVRTLVVFATKQSRFETVSRIPVERLKDSWAQAKAGLRYAVNFLGSNAGMDNQSLLTSPILVIPIAVLAVLRDHKINKEEEHELLHWVLVANAVGHYSVSSESTLDRDLSVLFRGQGPAELVELLKTQHGRLRFEPADFAGRTAQNPLFEVTYLALKRRGAKDWRSGLALSLDHAGRFHKLQAHHIFPRSVLEKKGVDRVSINEIANLAFISGGQNRSYGTKTPDQYLPGVVEARGEEALANQCVPTNPNLWRLESFDEFLALRRRELATAVNSLLDAAKLGEITAPPGLEAVVNGGESATLEFKRAIVKSAGAKLSATEAPVVKTVAAFMNSQGGTLIVGVTDSGTVVGIEDDIAAMNEKRSEDGYELLLRSVLTGGIGKHRAADIAILFSSANGKKICSIKAPASPAPVFVGDGGVQAFYVRSGNSTISLNIAQAADYIAKHFN